MPVQDPGWRRSVFGRLESPQMLLRNRPSVGSAWRKDLENLPQEEPSDEAGVTPWRGEGGLHLGLGCPCGEVRWSISGPA